MSTWLSNLSVSFAVVAQAGWCAMHLKAVSLVRPSTLRRVQTWMVWLIMVVVGY